MVQSPKKVSEKSKKVLFKPKIGKTVVNQKLLTPVVELSQSDGLESE